MTGRLSPQDLSLTATKLYSQGPLLLRLLQRYRPFICPFEELLPWVPPQGKLLDVGCGGGLFLGLAAHYHSDLSGIGFDVSSQAIAVAQAMRPHLPDGDRRLQFLCLPASSPWPAGTYDAVSVIDVIHHVPPAVQSQFFRTAVSHLAPGGLLIYKDMVDSPLWQSLHNRLHDLLIARDWIHYVPQEQILSWAGSLHLELVHSQSLSRGPYGHELLVFRRPLTHS